MNPNAVFDTLFSKLIDMHPTYRSYCNADKIELYFEHFKGNHPAGWQYEYIHKSTCPVCYGLWILHNHDPNDIDCYVDDEPEVIDLTQED